MLYKFLLAAGNRPIRTVESNRSALNYVIGSRVTFIQVTVRVKPENSEKGTLFLNLPKRYGFFFGLFLSLLLLLLPVPLFFYTLAKSTHLCYVRFRMID